MRISPNFTMKELACQHCGELPEEYGKKLAEHLEELRAAVGFGLLISSGYRCLAHPIELRKPQGSFHAHTVAWAADIRLAGERAFDIVAAAPLVGVRGLGIQQTGKWGSRFIHVDYRPTSSRTVWSYT